MERMGKAKRGYVYVYRCRNEREICTYIRLYVCVCVKRVCVCGGGNMFHIKSELSYPSRDFINTQSDREIVGVSVCALRGVWDGGGFGKRREGIIPRLTTWVAQRQGVLLLVISGGGSQRIAPRARSLPTASHTPS